MTDTHLGPDHQRGWIRWLLLFVLLALAAAGAYAWHDYQRFADTPLTMAGETMTFEVARGDSLATIVDKVAAAGLSPDWRKTWWQVLARQTETATRLKAGEYALASGLTPRGLLDQLAAGRVIQYRFTIVEGWTFAQLRQALATVTEIEHTLADQSEEQVMAALGAAGQHPEGRFLPETYAYTRGSIDLALLQRARQSMDEALAQAWQARSESVAVDSPEEALILASIIEKETGVPGERREISGVFSRRLGIGMRLQTDPTVIYGVGSSYDGNLRRRDLDTDTPYNTYTRAGLPPTPIAMPGRAALAAAVDPLPGRTLYFVSRGDGSHHFSATYDEHRRAVQQYQVLPARQRRAAAAASGE